MYPNRFKKGELPIKHKTGCKCFRCSGIPWNTGISTKHIIGEKISRSLIKNERRKYIYKNKHITYSGIHKWISKKMPNKGICSACHKNTKTEVSNNENIGRYNYDEWVKEIGEDVRNFKHWEWLCKSCHGKKDQWGDLVKGRQVMRNRRICAN